MNRLLPLLLFAMSSSAFASEPEPPVIWNNPERPPFAGLEHRSFHSAAMDVEIGYNVYVPPAHAGRGQKLPVVYFLHGATGNENSDAAGFAGVVARLIEQKKIPPIICVFPNGGPRSGYRDDPEQKSWVETAIVKELLPIVDRDFPTIARQESRAIVGFSMGGGGAVRFALTYPDLFSAAGSWAGAFTFRSNPEKTLPAEYSVASLAPLANRVRLLLIVGTKDQVLSWHPPLLQNLIEAKFPFQFELLADVEHDPGAYYERSGEKMLQFLTAGFPAN